jgi:hypothetical protein
VLNWVECYAAKAEGGVIPQSPGGKGMSCFMKGDRDQNRDDPRGGGIDGGWNVQVRSLCGLGLSVHNCSTASA